MSITGVFNSNSGIAGEKVGDFASAVYQTDIVGTAPLLALSSGMRNEVANDTVITWWAQNPDPSRSTITNNATTGATLVVADGSFIVPGMIGMIETTGEYVYVTAVTGNSLTVSRGFAGTTNTSINGSSTPVGFQLLFTAHKERASAPTAVSNQGYPLINYTQIFRNAYGNSRTAREIAYRTGNKLEQNVKTASYLHAADIERAMLFGRKSVNLLDGDQLRTMDGLIPMIKTNIASQSTSVDKDDIDDWLEDIFRYNLKGQPNERVALCGSTALRILGQIADKNTSMQVVPGATEYGYNYSKWITQFGTISLLTHPLFNESPLWRKDILVFHPGALVKKTLTPTFDVKFNDNGSNQGIDGDDGVITTEMSMIYGNELTAGIFTGIDTMATS